MTSRTAAVIPILNEAATIGSLVAEVHPQVDIVVVVDDGSTDGGPMAAAQAGATVLRHRSNAGKGRALATALEWARGQPGIEWLVLLDGDGQHDPTVISKLVADASRRGLDILVGSRFTGTSNAPLYRVVGLHVLSAAASLGSGVHLTDSQSGFRVLSRRAIERLKLTEDGFGVETEMQFQAARSGLRVGETPISIRYTGPARRSPVVHGVSVLLRTLTMTARYRPHRLPMLITMPVALWRLARRKVTAEQRAVGG
jgi:glycosyltransferase involved in cell wall biosynthesis